MAISDPGRGLVRRLGVTAAALLAFAAASQQRAEALSLASPGAAPSAKFATDGLDDRSAAWRPWRRRRFSWRWWRWLPRRRISWRWIQGWRRRVPWRRVQRRWRCDPSRRLSRRARVPRRRLSLRISPSLSPAALPSPASLPSPVLRAELLRIPILLWLPASLLPRDLDLLRAAQDLPLSSVVSSPLAPPLLRFPYRYW